MRSTHTVEGREFPSALIMHRSTHIADPCIELRHHVGDRLVKFSFRTYCFGSSIWFICSLTCAMLGSSGYCTGCWQVFGHSRDERSRLLPSSGHANEKNFVGLSVTADGYIATGSEDNSVVAYHASLPLPVARHSFAPAPGAHPQSISTELAGQLYL